MTFRNLRSFLSYLETEGDLLRIKTEVDPCLEITEIATRVVREKGPALLFENVKGSKFPLAINIFGSEKRIEKALGGSPEKLTEDLVRLFQSVQAPSTKKLWDNRHVLKRLMTLRPKKVSNPPVQENLIDPANLDCLPITQSWPKDGGRFITFPLVLTKSPQNGRQNLGVYRMQVFSSNETGMHWQIGKGGGFHFAQAESKDQPLPLMAVLGADPLLMICGVFPLPEDIEEMVVASFLRGEGTLTGEDKRTGLSYPAEAEFILEGLVPPQERRMEGPFGDHFGHYSEKAPFPVFKIKKIWHRDHPIYPAAVVGKPPQEDKLLGEMSQKLLFPLLKLMHP
ncbi:MAG: UbiD family decarboxylase, partial [Elusimicrobia bacterium]|nr:UbiD family decarboxylase [Candidatus Obscuribacterium magneticum]